MSELFRSTASEIHARLKGGDISPLDCLEALESRIAAVDSKVNALPTLCFDRARAHARDERRFAGIGLSDRNLRVGILGGALALRVLVLGMLGYRWYDNNIAQPRSTILSVGGQTVSLRY